MKTIELELHKQEYSWEVKIRKTSEAGLCPQYTPFAIILATALQALISMIAWGSIVALILTLLCFLYQFYLSHHRLQNCPPIKICKSLNSQSSELLIARPIFNSIAPDTIFLYKYSLHIHYIK